MNCCVKIVALGLSGPITLVLDNARYQHNATVKALAKQLGDHVVIPPLVLAELEPDRTPVEVHQTTWPSTAATIPRSRRFKPPFRRSWTAFRPTTYAKPLETLITLNFQMFEDVSLMAA